MQNILAEGYAASEILSFPREQVEALVATGEPFVLSVGSARLLGEFRVREGRLSVELAQVEGGGEGVLATLWLLSERYARRHGMDEVEWIVHALSCAAPNPKLVPLLLRRGFAIQDVPGVGLAYYHVRRLAPDADAQD